MSLPKPCGSSGTARARAEASGTASADGSGAQEVIRIIDALRGRSPAYVARSRPLRAHMEAAPDDPDAVARLDGLRDELIRSAPDIRETAAVGELPFFEAYCSNFIDGTEFEVDDARRIIVDAWDPADRPADAHDVRCAFTLVADDDEMRRTARNPAEFQTLLRERHRGADGEPSGHEAGTLQAGGQPGRRHVIRVPYPGQRHSPQGLRASRL